MAGNVGGARFTFLGGDLRAIEAARMMIAWGAEVTVCALPVERIAGAREASGIEEAVSDADAVIGPILPPDDNGYLTTLDGQGPLQINRRKLAAFPRGSLFFIGKAGLIADWAEGLPIKIVEYRELDEFAILNSIPSAEGAIQMAMEETDITIWGSKCAVIGYGRTGITLARMLKGLGAKTLVVARRNEVRARALESGHETADFADLGRTLADIDIVFNTVPAAILTAQVLDRLRPATVIIDIASAPGGTDFNAARQRGLKALLCPSLPGRVAPVTAGQILAQVIAERFLAEKSPLR